MPTLAEGNIVVDIGRAGDALKAIAAELNYQNLDEGARRSRASTPPPSSCRQARVRPAACRAQGRPPRPGLRGGRLDEDHAVGEPYRLGSLRGGRLSRGRRLALAYPGDLESRTGGYLYDRRLALELEARGWRVDRLSLPDGFPFPAEADLAATSAALGGLPAGSTVLVDGLALGAMPDLARSSRARLDLVALVHHPLCLETGLTAAQSAALAASERAALAWVRAVIVTSPRTAASLTELFGVPPAKLTVALPGTDVVPSPAAPAATAAAWSASARSPRARAISCWSRP